MSAPVFPFLDTLMLSTRMYATHFLRLYVLSVGWSLSFIPGFFLKEGAAEEVRAWGMVALLPAVFLGAVFSMAMIAAIRAAVDEDPQPLSQIFRDVLPRVPAFLGAGALVLLSIFLVSLPFGLLGLESGPARALFLGTLMGITLLFSFFSFAVVLEQCGPVAALRRSMGLAFRGFPTLILAALLVFFAGVLVLFPLVMASSLLGVRPEGLEIVSLVSNQLFAPLVAVYFYHLFLHLRGPAA